MAHAHDRTLLASLGFQDADRNERRHTLACQYLSDPGRGEHLLRLARPTLFTPDPGPAALMEGEAPTDRSLTSGPWTMETAPSEKTYAAAILDKKGREECRFGSMRRGRCEVAVRRKQYLIGFRDVEFSSSVNLFVTRWKWREDPSIFEMWRAYYGSRETGAARPACPRRWLEPDWWVEVEPDRRSYGSLYVEVKIGRCDAALIARQIETYRQGETTPYTMENDVVAVTWTMDDGDKQMLSDRGITVVRLGRPFEAWCRAREQEGSTSDVEV